MKLVQTGIAVMNSGLHFYCMQAGWWDMNGKHFNCCLLAS